MLRAGLFVLFLAITSFYIWQRLSPWCVCTEKNRLDGKVALITNGASFLGREVAAEFARRGAKVLIGGQHKLQVEGIVDSILQSYGSFGERKGQDIASPEMKTILQDIQKDQFQFIEAHINSMNGVREFAKEIQKQTDRLDFLFNNAAPNHGPYSLSDDRYELTMAIGHLAHYLLTDLLSALLLKTMPASRVIVLSSAEHYGGSFADLKLFLDHHEFNSIRSLAQLKLANTIHAVILAENFANTSVLPVSVHPGYVLPDFGVLTPALIGSFFKTRWEASQAVMHAALADNLKPGGYYANCKLTQPDEQVTNETIVNFIREQSNKLVYK